MPPTANPHWPMQEGEARFCYACKRLKKAYGHWPSLPEVRAYLGTHVQTVTVKKHVARGYIERVDHPKPSAIGLKVTLRGSQDLHYATAWYGIGD